MYWQVAREYIVIQIIRVSQSQNKQSYRWSSQDYIKFHFSWVNFISNMVGYNICPQSFREMEGQKLLNGCYINVYKFSPN